MSKVRVHELAKGLNLQSKELINIISGLGVEVKSHMSILEGKDLETVIGHFRKMENKKLLDVFCRSVLQNLGDRSVIGNHETVESPLLSQDIGHHPFVGCSRCVVDEIE